MKHLKETLIDILPSIKIYEKLKLRKTKKQNYFCITALEDGKISFRHLNDLPSLYYSFDALDWFEWDFSDIEIQKGDNVYFLGDNKDGFTKEISRNNSFEINSKVNISGNLLSLINGDYDLYTFTNEDMQTNSCFYKLFSFNKGIIDASKLILPDNVRYACFDSMFSWCDSLIATPELPVTELADYCYFEMFRNCNSLTKAPKLPAIKLAKHCYNSMFEGCTVLTKAPDLPVTELFDFCYAGMFEDCTALTKAPDLPATKLAEYCYSSMFEGCTALTKAPDLPATKLAPHCYEEMFMDSGIKTMPVIKAKVKISNHSLYTINMLKGTSVSI